MSSEYRPAATSDNLDPSHVATVQRQILEWYQAHQRDLPWRKTRDPYRILVSEIMLQQTQVDRVIPKYHEFLDHYPTIAALASASASDVIRLWSGLGYNRRAVNLQRAAQAVMSDHNGVMPRMRDELERLPGIGPYTAGAIACFAFEQDVGFFDTNIRRVLHRIFLGPEVPQERVTDRQMQELAAAVVPAEQGYQWNQGIMEFGALQCTSRKPACLTCPLQQQCSAFPEIQSILADLKRSGFRRKKEEAFTGSSRYYRGRVIEALRSIPARQSVDLYTLGPAVRSDFTDEHLPWLQDVVKGLARDGLAEIAEDPVGYYPNKELSPRVRLPQDSEIEKDPE